MKPLTFSGTSVRPEADLLQLQPTHLTLRKAELTKERRLYLDTPDQRLQSRDRWLFLQERSGTADSLIRGEGLWADAPVPVGKEPDFLWNLPPQLAEQLRSTIKMRRLVTRLRVELKIQIFRLEDKRQKTVARVHLLQGRVFRPGSRRSQPLSPRTIVIPLKGYPKPFNRMVSMLGTSPEFEKASQSLYQEGLEVLGLTKSGEISRPRITPGMSTFSGLQQILDSLRQIIEENAEGLQEPLDTEYLHRFRVAIRQTRTLLSQARKAFPKRDLQRFLNFFSRLGKTFGVARDLDVYLLKLNGYDSQWPDRFGRHLVTLRSRIEQARVKEQARLNRLLNSQRYRGGMDAWEIFLKTPEPRLQEAERNIEIFAASKIWNCYRKIRKVGKKLSPVGPAEPIHRMRIRFKKLRYLIEFFSPLFDSADISRIVSEVKKMQDDLGNFNDCSVQAAWLEDQSHQEGDRSPLGRSLALLSEDLKNQSGHLTKIFGVGFQRFLRPKNRRLFRRLFKGA